MTKALVSITISSISLSFLVEILTTGRGLRDPAIGSVMVRALIWILLPALLTLLPERLYRAVTQKPLPHRTAMLWVVWFLVAGLSTYGILTGPSP